MTLKGVFIFLLILLVAGCAIFHMLDQGTKPHVIKDWACKLGSTESDMLAYLKDATGIYDPVVLQDRLSVLTPSWSAFLGKSEPELEDLVRRYDGPEINRHLEARRALHALAQHMSAVRKAYLRDDRGSVGSRVYAGLFKELAGDAYSSLEGISGRDPKSPFLSADDAEIWGFVRKFISELEGETHKSTDLKNAFSGISFDQPLMVVERMRYEPVVQVLLLNLPSHQALGELFKVLADELPRP